MKYIALLLAVLSTQLCAQDYLIGHGRERQPEMFWYGNRLSGPVVEMIEKSLTRHGLEIRWADVPWMRSILMAQQGSVDLLPRHSMTEEREQYLLPVLYGYEVRKVSFFKRKDASFEVKNYDDLAGLVIGDLKNSFYFERYYVDDSLDKVSVTTNQQLLEMLLAGRFDVAIISDGQSDRHIFDTNPDIVAVDYTEFLLNGRYFSLAKNSAAAQYYPTILKEIYAMRKNGEVTTIFYNYNVQAPMQNFDHPESLAQLNLIESLEDASKQMLTQ